MQHLQRRQQGSLVWGLNEITDFNLPECGPVSLFLNTTQVAGQQPASAPYSLIAYPVQGLPSVYPLSLSGAVALWTVNYPAGTQLVLNIADANGNSGGVPPGSYTVRSAQSKACLSSASTPVVTMKIDEPSALKTCAVLPIHIEGGQKPYTVTLAVANSIAPSNKTLGSDHDTFEWVNQSATNSTFIVAVSDSKGQYAITSKIFTTSGSADASCPGQSSRSYNSNNPNSGSNNSTSSSNGSNGNNGNNGNNGSSTNNQIPIGAIIGAAVGAMALLGLFLFICFRRKNKGQRKGGVGLWERQNYHRPTLDHSPGGSQAPFTHHNIGEPMHQNNVQPTPFVHPGTSSSAALSYYGDSPTLPTQNRSSQYLPPTSVLAPPNLAPPNLAPPNLAPPNLAPPNLAPPNYQQRPEDQQGSQSLQFGFAYPPPSPSMAPSVYPPSTNQGTTTSTAQRMAYNADMGTTATYLNPQRASTNLGTSVYSDKGSRHSTYTAHNPAPSQGSERGTSVQGAAAGQKIAEARREKGGLQPSQTTSNTPPMYQHEDAGGVVELPPAYREYSATSSSAPPPP